MKKLILISLLMGMLAYTGFAASYTSSGSGNWNNAATWGGSGVPGATDDATILTGHTVTLTANAACNNLTLNGTSGTRLAIGDYTLEVNGTLNGPGTSFTNNVLTTGTGQLKFIGSSRALFGANWAGTPPAWRCEVALNSGATGTASTHVKIGFLIVTSGTFTIGTAGTNNRDLRIDGGAGDGSGTVEIANGATLIVTGIMGARTGTATTYCGAININGTLTIQGSRLNGTININTGGTLLIKRLSNVTGLVHDGPGGSIPGDFTYAAGSTLQYDLEGTTGRMLTGAEIGLASGPRYIPNLIVNNANGINIQASPNIRNSLRIQAGNITTSSGQTISYGTGANLYYADPTLTTTSSMELPDANAPTNLIIENSPPTGIALHSSKTLTGYLNVNSGAVFNIGSYQATFQSGTSNINGTVNANGGTFNLSSLNVGGTGAVNMINSFFDIPFGIWLYGALNIDGGTMTVDGDLNISAGNQANVTISDATFASVNGNINQELEDLTSGTNYGSLIGTFDHIGQFNFLFYFGGELGKGLKSSSDSKATGRWILISPPVSGATAAMFNCQYIMKHDPITNTWIDIIDPDEPLKPGVDYALWIHNDDIPVGDPVCAPNIVPLLTFTWTGPMNSGPIVTPLLCDDPILEGWNNVGNPYQATIDWDAIGWIKTNVNDAIYIENKGLWASYVGGVGNNGGTQYVAPGQGFFVQCNNITGGSLGFNPVTRTHTRASFFKNEISNILRLKATGNEKSDETVIRFNDNATSGFDGNFDARKILSDVTSHPEIPQIFSMDNNRMSINTLPSTDKVALGFSAGQSGEYTISASEINDIAIVLLEDLTNGQVTDMKTSSYSFSYNKGDNEGRFMVHFAPLSINDPVSGNIIVFSDQNKINVIVPDNTQGNIYISTILGQQVFTGQILDAKTTITVSESGYYFVKVTSNNSVVTKKVFVR